MSNNEIKISVRITQEQYNFLTQLFPESNTSESIRFAIQMLSVLVDRGFYCKLMDCPKLSDKPINKEKRHKKARSLNT